jgi:hypothetical protein
VVALLATTRKASVIALVIQAESWEGWPSSLRISKPKLPNSAAVAPTRPTSEHRRARRGLVTGGH